MGYQGKFSGEQIDERLTNAGDIPDMKADIDAIRRAVGTPLTASTAAGMTDKTKIYVYVGSETGYTYGNWYYWDGSVWASGGVYNSQALPKTDKTLSAADVPADAEATGVAVNDLKSALNEEINGTNGLYYKIKPFVITSTNKWSQSTQSHVSIPVSTGDVVSIVQNADSDGVYAFLKTDNAASGVTADFATGETGRYVLPRGESSGNKTVPSDCTVLYFTAIGLNAVQQLPEKIVINGVDIAYNIRKKIDGIELDVEQVRSEIPLIDNTLSVEGHAADAKAVGDTLDKAFAQIKDVEIQKSVYDIWGLRSVNIGEYAPVTLPAFAHLDDIDLTVLSDGYNFKTICDLSAYKNISEHTFTVSTDAELVSAIENATNGDTIVLNAGAYSAFEVNKPLNLIGNGRVIIERVTSGGFDATSTAGIWRTKNEFSSEPSAVYQIVDDIPVQLTRYTSVNSVVSHPGSYVYSSSKIYVHLLGEAEPTELNVLFNNGTDAVIKSDSPTADGTLYLENLMIFGGKYNIHASTGATYVGRKLIAVDCIFSSAWNNNGVGLAGVDGYFQRCVSEYAYRDGFNYHYDSTDHTILSNGLEIDCIGHDNGSRETGLDSPSNNGSTMHDGGKIVRINGLYYNNNGANVADASPQTESYNYGCVAFDSKAPKGESNTDRTSADFWIRYGNMHCYGCRAVGDSENHICAILNGTVYVNKCEYARTEGNIVEM